MVLMTLRRASTLAPRVAWKPKATLSGRLEGLLQAPAEKDDPAAAQRLAQWLRDKRNVVVLTGAGLSTDSGIPDYRGKAGSYRLGHVPIGHDEFMRNESSRRRYWARALVGCGPVWKSNFRRSTPSTRVPIIHWLMSTQVSGLCGGEAERRAFRGGSVGTGRRRFPSDHAERRRSSRGRGLAERDTPPRAWLPGPVHVVRSRIVSRRIPRHAGGAKPWIRWRRRFSA